MTTKEIKKMYEKQYPGGADVLEMACEGGAIYEVHEKWMSFLDELLEAGLITNKRKDMLSDSYFGKQIKRIHEETVAYPNS